MTLEAELTLTHFVCNTGLNGSSPTHRHFQQQQQQQEEQLESGGGKQLQKYLLPPSCIKRQPPFTNCPFVNSHCISGYLRPPPPLPHPPPPSPEEARSMPVIHALVARGADVLAEYSSTTGAVLHF